MWATYRRLCLYLFMRLRCVSRGLPCAPHCAPGGGSSRLPLTSLGPLPSADTGPGKRKREDEAPILEQRENRMNPLRCPVKFYEFYLSKW